ncbi:MAG: biotin--[acetyl-CoA-carboxylase] ligase [Prevotellaceae bacterium]|jgi:BirA family biotin operon repressor/biotin-[acetyl-CoA-carboxylase] ligase|nr:biotin--[acetyl-CoA-carboxylase] ligase [Prevotellaceae bacterium]
MITWLSEIDSTNRYAAQRSADAPEGSVWAAFTQTAGRGQQHNSWESEPHKNLTFSLLLRPVWLPAEEQFYLSKAVSLGITGFLRQHGLEPAIKWPNDVYAGDRKIAGILIENQITGSGIGSSIVGIGLNVNQERFFSDAPNPTSIVLETGRTLDLQQALPELTACILNRYESLRAGDRPSLDADYHAQLYRCNQWHLFATDATRFRARIVGVRPSGELLLEDEQRQTRAYLFKEVHFCLKADETG